MKRRYWKPYKRGLALLTMAACVCTLMAGCGRAEEEETMSEVIPVQVQKPEAGTLTLKNEFVGTVSPEEAVYVISMVSAEVVSTNVSVGDVVNAGDVLCKLDSEAAELQLASAQVQYESAAAGANAAQIGYEAAQSQYEMAQSQYEGTIAQLDAQMWGQKNLQIYQLQANIESIEASIDSMEKQKKEFEAERKLYEQLLAGSSSGTSAAGSQTNLEDEQSDPASADVGTPEQRAVSADSGGDALTTIDNSLKQLDSAIEEAKRGLEQAQTVMNITQDQIYADTQRIVDANKETAALSLDSASLGIDSAAASVNSAQIGMEGAQVAVDSAEYQLDMYTLKAPISGVIEAVNIKEHDFATPSTPAYIISNKDTMTVTFYVSEGIRNTLSVGQQVSVDRNGKLFDAAITEIGSMIDQTTGLFAIKTCVSAPDESMLTGCSVKVTADTYSQDGVLLIPYDAVYYDDSQPYVYVAVDNLVERRDIETGIFDEQTITVLSGLTIEDQLITSWSANLREGALISIQSAQNFAAESSAANEE